MARVAIAALIAVYALPAEASIEQPALRSAAPDVRKTSYDAAFFAKYAPRTAYDIVQRIPGFTLDLGANNNSTNGNTDIRGFAGVAGNVVVNGQRPSTKSETLDVYLARIPASNVKGVEIGPGDLYGADYASKSQVANLIIGENGKEIAGNAAVTVERHYTGKISPTGSGSITVSRGQSTFNIAGDTARLDQTEKGTDLVTDLATHNTVEFRRKVNVTRNYSPFISASWLLDSGPNRSANLNVRYHYDGFLLHQYNRDFPASSSEHFDQLIEDYRTKTFELGGDFTHPLLAGALKLVGLLSRQRRSTLDQYDRGNFDHSEVVGGTQQLSHSTRNESLGRFTWTRSKLLGFQLETGGEVAWNTLGYDLNLFDFDEKGARTPIYLPIANARVTELRTEFWINGSRPLTKTLSVDLGLNYETSKLEVDGNASAKRNLKFVKPNLALDWQFGDRWRGQVILRRTVAQLDFYDFISVADLASTEVNGGNANLEPQRDWEGRLAIEHPLFRQGKVRIELGYNLIGKLQDRILTCSNAGCFDAPGNIGTGRLYSADVTFDAPLERLWKGLRVKLHGNAQRTRVQDPISGKQRAFSGFFPAWEWDADIRRDAGKWAYGLQLSDNARTSFYRTDILDTRYNVGFPYTSAFIEYRPTQTRSLRLFLDNISDSAGVRDLLFFDPNRTGVASRLDHRFRNGHVRVGFTYKQSVGGAGPAAHRAE